jgi:hypothetical protein
MQIVSNSTGMAAALSVAVDKEGRDYCVVVVKGTYAIEADGSARLADEQEKIVLADIHHGDPDKTSVKYECEFAPFKPLAELIINGQAYSPTGEPVTEVLTGIQVGPVRKIAKVLGDRIWQKTVGGLSPSPPQPFVTMPLIYERAFGGSDHTHENPKHHGTETRNPLGRGFNKNPNSSAIADRPLPNLEDPARPIESWSDVPAPIGFGSVGRGWHPRIQYAGTYDDRWLAERSPFLPADFVNEYFLAAPVDQQMSSLRGQTVQCLNMAPQRIVVCMLPEIDLQISGRLGTSSVEVTPVFDTAIIEPDKYRFMAIWRAAIPLGRKIHALRDVSISEAA